ncbi:uncharacterized protein EI97DRAFT_429978 [Westerdykella ornata]|uniref:Protein HRI1 n=1 Tax=Westerdykella ornata TaxID=318751 RepID=A0A6A6JVT6_WESOR|nr:uncharacterized protein EI97DRAFT_429978 [Westerdykella ornata]KAF2280223.1 hypothetical protein EI97DRAFT_429978 [Westerdykella ornata]
MDSPTITTSHPRAANSIKSTPPSRSPSEGTTLQDTPPNMDTARPASPCPPGNTNISTRVYIYPLPYPLPPNTPIPYSTSLPHRNPLRLPYPPSEPTSTLVLTSPASNFVDLRFFKPRLLGEPELPNETSPTGEGSGRIEWAFAGQSVSVPFTGNVYKMLGGRAPETESDAGTENAEAVPVGEENDANDAINAMDPQSEDVSSSSSLSTASTVVAASHVLHTAPLPHPRKSTWQHWLDSRYPLFSPYIPIDTGVMYSLPNQPDLTLEVGSAPSPFSAHGHINYEELWRDEPIKAVGERCRDAGGDGKRVAVTLRTEERGGEGARGLVVRVGQFVQGIMKRGERLSVERWEFVEQREGVSGQQQGTLRGGEVSQEDAGEAREDREGGGMWTRTAKVGPDFVPCPVAQREQDLSVSGQIDVNGLTWTVEELVEW